MLGSSAHVKVRRSKAADAASLARVFRESWLHAYRGIIPHLHLENLVQRRGVGWWRSALRAQEPVLALEVGGTLGGYATFGAARTRCPYQGEIYELYLAPNYQGLGLGEYLFEACRYELDMRRLDGLLVWALTDNTPAIDFYWRRGGRPIGRAFDRIGGAKLEKIAFAWP